MLTRDNSGLEIRFDRRGRAKLFFKGARVPAVTGVIIRSSGTDYGTIYLEIAGSMVKFSSELAEEEPNDGA
jgi:hypothetical protein